MITILPVLAAAAAACLAVAGDRITAADLARALPAFAGIAPETALGHAPAPGARRTYTGAELTRLARRYGVALEPGSEACFVRPVETLTAERVAAALRLALPEAQVEVLEVSRQPVPSGELRFRLPDLQPAAAGKSMWRGAVVRAGQADFPVWTRVRVHMSATRVTAAVSLRAGEPIARQQLREESYDGPPGPASLEQIVGRVARRPVPAGAVIQPQWLEAPASVVRGQRVSVEVRSGRARLLLEGQAQAAGRPGDLIAVRNPANGKTFRARVEENGRVVVADRGGTP